jgi:dipeptide/tripeptide permease
MEHKPINKKLAVTFLIVINFFCFWVFWKGYNEIKEIIALLYSHADVIRVGSRAGFFVVVIGVPIICLLPVVEKIWANFVKKYSKLITKCTIIGVIALLAAGFFGSSWIKARVENAGYTYCRNASGISALARTLVYTKNMDICEELVETKRKRQE